MGSTKRSGTLWAINRGVALLADHNASGAEWQAPLLVLRDAKGSEVRIGDRFRFTVTQRVACDFEWLTS